MLSRSISDDTPMTSQLLMSRKEKEIHVRKHKETDSFETILSVSQKK